MVVVAIPYILPMTVALLVHDVSERQPIYATQSVAISMQDSADRIPVWGRRNQ